MYSREIDNLAHSAELKAGLFNRSITRYIVSAMLGSIFVSFGVMLVYTIGGIMHHADLNTYRIMMGVSFGVALSLVLMAGGDLFTSNALILTMGTLRKAITLADGLKVLFASWVGNIMGGWLAAVLFVKSGLISGKNSYIGDFFVDYATTKITTPAGQLVIRGLLCNILVCLSVWFCYKLKEETAKILMIFWCLFTFITAGFEHSVANMSFLAMAYLVDPTAITLGGYAYNIIFVSIGNFIGGMVFLALPYYFITSGSKKDKKNNLHA